MAIRDLKGTVDDKIPVSTIIVSVFDKSGLEDFIPGLLKINCDLLILSTGGTYRKIAEMLGEDASENLMEVAEYTGFPEMEGGLVKTLHPKIHAGLLGERHNPEHRGYLRELGGDFIDMVVVNLYPFEDIVKKIEAGEIDPKTGKPYNFESARGNIDIGGPTMLRAAAKNFPSCAAICDPKDYAETLRRLRENSGCTTFDQRLSLAKKVFDVTADYDAKIARYIGQQTIKALEAIRACYQFT